MMIRDTSFDLVHSSYLIAWCKLPCEPIKSSTPLFLRMLGTIILLVIAWRKLERGSNKMVAPPIITVIVVGIFIQ